MYIIYICLSQATDSATESDPSAKVYQEQLMCVCDRNVVSAAASTKTGNKPKAVSSTDGSNVETRVLMIIPPMSPALDNPFAIHVTQLDYGTQVVPKGFVALYLSTLACDADCHTSETEGDADNASVLERALRVLVAKADSSSNSSPSDSKQGPQSNPIVWARVLQRRLVGAHKAAAMVASCSGLHAIPDRTESLPKQLELDLRHVVHRAELMFNELLPGEMMFPPKSEANEEVSAEDDYALSAMERLRLPQLVDLTFYEFLGGKMERDDKAEFLASAL
jgi:hypothetical protein